MEVEARVFYWSKGGMSAKPPVAHAVGYVQVGEVERLLEDAHRRGVAQGRDLEREAAYAASQAAALRR